MPALDQALTERGKVYRGVNTAQRVADRRARLIEAAIQLFGTQGYHNTTVRGICAAARLSERYFYESFSSSEGLLLAAFAQVVERQFTRLEAAIVGAEPTPDARMRAALTTYLADAGRDPAMTRLTLLEPRTVSEEADAAFRAVQRRVASLITRIVNTDGTREPRPGLSANLLAIALASAFNGLALAWLESNFEQPLDEMIRTCMAVYTAMTSLWVEARPPQSRTQEA